MWPFIIIQRQESTVRKSNIFIHPPGRLQYLPQPFEQFAGNLAWKYYFKVLSTS